MAARLHLRPGLAPLRRGRDAVQLGLDGASGGIIVEGLAPQEIALLQRLDRPPDDGLRPPDLYAAAAELGVLSTRADELAVLLRRHGALVDAGTDAPDPPGPSDGSHISDPAVLSDTAGAAGVTVTGLQTVHHGPRADVRDRNGSGRGSWLVVDGVGPLADAVGVLLRACGARRVDTGRWAADVADAEVREREAAGAASAAAGLAGAPHLVVTVSRCAPDPGPGEPWRTRDVPLLPVLEAGGRVLVGPVVTADPALPCLRCLQLARVDRDAHWPEVMAQVAGPSSRSPGEVAAGPLARADVLSVAAGVVVMVARAALAATTGSAVDPAGGVSVEVTAPWPRLDHRRWTRHPACLSHATRREREGVAAPVAGGRRAAPPGRASSIGALG